MLGDPDPARSLRAIRLLVSAGADGLELGLPFSDPVADGPVIQAAATRALARGVRRADCWKIVAAVREEFPTLPIGLLVYANLAFHRGEPDRFYADAAAAGVDSVLIADLPLIESEQAVIAARAHGIAPVFIAPPNLSSERLALIAAEGEGYTYLTSRPGVTGEHDCGRGGQSRLIESLKALGAPPPVQGFGISTPVQVRTAISGGALGAISGSAIVRRIAEGGDIAGFVGEMKAATRREEKSG
jgi:tryptophan synthase alpha chain